MNTLRSLTLLLCIAAAFSIRIPSSKLPSSFFQSTCDALEKGGGSMFHQVRCAKPGEDFAAIGKKFLKTNLLNNKPLELQPVFLIPGFGGSALEAKLHKTSGPAWYCFQNSNWFRIWLELSELFVQDCWSENLRVHYDADTDTYYNSDGVDIRPIDFGGVSGIEYLDDLFGYPIPMTSVYATMVESLKALGYQERKNLFGIPYDFRIPPDATGSELYDNIQNLIEEAYTKNNNTKVHVVTHSMGGPTFLFFLNKQSETWRDKYIASFVPIAGPWAGSPKALRGLVSGDNLGIEFLGMSLADKLKFRSIVRSAGGLVFLVPDPLFWEDQVFIYGKDKNYTVHDLHQLFVDIGAVNTSIVYDKEWRLIPKLQPPMVKTHCLYGTNTPTEFFYHYPTNDWDSDPVYIDYSDAGDGSVPLRSLQECSTWSSKQDNVVVKEFDTREHRSIIEDPEVVEYVLTVVTGGTPGQ